MLFRSVLNTRNIPHHTNSINSVKNVPLKNFPMKNVPPEDRHHIRSYAATYDETEDKHYDRTYDSAYGKTNYQDTSTYSAIPRTARTAGNDKYLQSPLDYRKKGQKTNLFREKGEKGERKENKGSTVTFRYGEKSVRAISTDTIDSSVGLSSMYLTENN